MEFTTEELFDAIDKVVRELLDLHDAVEPPVDAVTLVEAEFDYVTREAEPEDDEPQPGRFGPRARPGGRRREVVFRPDQTDESRQAACARACAKELIPRVLARLGVVTSPEHRPATAQFVGLIAPRILLPTRWFTRDAARLGYDLLALKDRYPTAGYELITLRLLDLEEPSVIAVVDDGVVGTRRSNRYPVNKTLTEAESRCREQVAEDDEPHRVRFDGWTTWGWPVSGGPFRRIILRSQPDEV